MLPYISAGPYQLPSYGIMVLLGAAVCGCTGQYLLQKHGGKIWVLLLAAIPGGLGALLGARGLYWFNQLLAGEQGFPGFWTGGYAYMGGLAGFLLVMWAAGKCLRFPWAFYGNLLIFLVPLMHAFWKVGCFLAGCCMGISYAGPGAVVFPETAQGPGGPVLPIQLAEAALSLAAALTLYYLGKKRRLISPAGACLAVYGITRFCVEFFRYHPNGSILAPSHLYALLLLGIGGALWRKKRKKEYKA